MDSCQIADQLVLGTSFCVPPLNSNSQQSSSPLPQYVTPEIQLLTWNENTVSSTGSQLHDANAIPSITPPLSYNATVVLTNNTELDQSQQVEQPTITISPSAADPPSI